MENNKRTWKKSIFTRLVFTFLLIMVPIYGIGIGIYNLGISTLKEEISNSMITKVTFYLNLLEKDIQRIKMLQYDFLNDQDLDQLSGIPESMSDFEKTQAILKLQKRLKSIMGSSTYIKGVSAHIPLLNKTISASEGVVEFQKEDYELLKKIRPTSSSEIIYMGNRLFLSLEYPLAVLVKGREFLYIIQIEFNNDEFENALSQFNTYKESGSLLINSLQNYTITSNPNIGTINHIQDLIKNRLKYSKNGKDSILINGNKYLLTYTTSEYLNMTLSNYIPEYEVFKPLDRYTIWFWIFTGVSLVIIILFSVSTYNFIQKPLLKVIKSFKKVENWEFDIAIEHRVDDEFGYIYRRFNAMVENLRLLIDQVYKQKILAQRSELKQLQAQINPHFLYNSFFILHRMIKVNDNENAIMFSKQLGNYFQFITRSASDEVELSEEIKHARIYTNIQSIRFRNRIKVEFNELPEKYNSILVPRLILQPIIENVFEHGLEDKVGDGIIRITFIEHDDAIHIVINDNGNGIDEEQMGKMEKDLNNNEEGLEITGILNIHKRLKLKFGAKGGLRISNSQLGGLCVEIVINIE